MINGGPTTISPATAPFTYTHDITNVFDFTTDTIIGGMLTIRLSDPLGGNEMATVTFDSGSAVNLGAVPTALTPYVFKLDGTLYGGDNLRADLQADGKITVTLNLTNAGGPTRSYVFNSSTLAGTAIPEPSSLFLLGAGLLGLAGVRRAPMGS